MPDDLFPDPGAAERMALDCLILPAPDDIVQRAVAMLDKTAVTPPGPWRELAMGLAEYRHGKFAGAAARLEKAVEFQENSNAAMQSRLVLAMARSQLGKPGQAPVVSEDKLKLSGGDWNEQMTTALLAREARRVIVK